MWEAVIGLEVHARLLTRTKIFCSCSTAFGAPPNTQVCPVCLGYPGALPVLNGNAVELATRMALATECEVHETSVFARKNYFYPDLPKGYQITQYDRPLATHGKVRGVRIARIHMEEDAGKLLHGETESYVDLNRAGAPLIEIVTEPDIHSSEEALAYLTRLRQILMYTGACDGNMEEGSLRCDANVSVHRRGEPLGTRTEVKNLNSFRFLGRAVEFEIARQIEVLARGGTVEQETRLFDPAAGETRVMRAKGDAHDYRYFPDPDVPPLVLDRAWIEAIRASLPALPDARIARYHDEFSISEGDAEVIVASREVAEYFEAVAIGSGNPRAAGNWVRNDVLRVLNEKKIDIGEFKVPPKALAAMIGMIDRGELGGKAAKEVFEEMAETGASPDDVMRAKGLAQIVDPEIIREAALRVLARNEAQVAQFRGGTTKVFGYLVGELMKETRGKAKADLANTILRELLTENE
jgi:aspartyl-tRNA(Asn)/glutamyl-tRNA(Gln) amidotransferase subunit B